MLPDRVALIVKALEEKIEGVKVEEKARADLEAKGIAESLLAFVEEQQEAVRKGKEELLSRVRSVYLKKGEEVSELEAELVGRLTGLFGEEGAKEERSWEGLKSGILTWADATRVKAGEDSNRIFEETLAGTSINSDEELRFLVMCHDSLTNLALERVSLLSTEYLNRVDEQVRV